MISRIKSRPLIPIFFILAMLVSGCIAHKKHTYVPSRRPLGRERVKVNVKYRDRDRDGLSNPFYQEILGEYFKNRLKDKELSGKRAIFYQGLCFYRDQAWEKAIEWFRMALIEYPYNIEYTMFYLAESLKKQGDFVGTGHMLRQIINAFPESPLIPEVYLNLADTYFYQNEYKEAMRVYTLCLDLLPAKRPYIKYQMGLIALKTGDFDAASENFKVIMIEEPESIFCESAQENMRISSGRGLLLSSDQVFEKAESLFNRRRYGPAIETYLSILDRDLGEEKRCKAILHLAQAYKRSGKKGRTIELLEAHLEDMGYSECALDARLYLARQLWTGGRRDDAAKHLEFLLRNYPSWSRQNECIYLRGRIEEEKGGFDEAIRFYSRIMDGSSSAPFYVTAVWRIGWSRYMEGNYEDAAYYFGKYSNSLQDKELRHRFVYWKGRAEEKLGQSDKAEKTFDVLLNDGYWSYYSGMAEMRMGGKKKADSAFFDIRPEKIDLSSLDEVERALINRIWELWFLGLREDANKEIRQIAYKQGGITPEMLYLLAISADANGDYELGIRIGILYRIALEKKGIPSYGRKEILLYPLGFLPLVIEKSRDNDLDPLLVLSVIRQESLFDPFAFSVSSAHGLMQMIPPTASELAKRLDMDLCPDLTCLFDPELNLTLGCFFLKGLLKRFSDDLPYALAAYNAGPDAANKWQVRFADCDMDEFIENIPYGETRDYVKRILKNYWIYGRLYSL